MFDIIAAIALGCLLALGLVGAAFSIRRALVSPQQRDEEFQQNEAKRLGRGRHV